jgi:hypothetical protein
MQKLSGEGSGEGGKTRLSRISPVGLSTSARLRRVLAGKMKERRPLAGLARDKSGLVLLLVWWMSANDSLLSQMSTNLLSNSPGKRVPRAVLPASYCSPATTVNDVRLLSSKPSEIRTSSQGLYKLLTEILELQYSARHCRWEIDQNSLAGCTSASADEIGSDLQSPAQTGYFSRLP